MRTYNNIVITLNSHTNLTGESNIQDQDGLTVLHHAAKSGDLAQLKNLLKKHIHNLHCYDYDGKTPLDYAIEYGQLEATQCLLKAYTEATCVSFSRQGNVKTLLDLRLKSDFSKEDTFGVIDVLLDLVHDACTQKITPDETIEVIQQMGSFLLTQADEIALAVNEIGLTFLHFAGFIGDIELIKGFLEKGMAINCYDLEGKTPLYYAIQNGHLEAIHFLLTRQMADPLSYDDAILLLHAVIALIEDSYDPNTDNIKIIKTIHLISGFVLNQRNDIAVIADKNGTTFLHIAALAGDISMMQTLLNKGMAVNCHTLEHKMPLYYAIENAQLEAVDFLLKHNMKINLSNIEGHFLLNALLNLIADMPQANRGNKKIVNIVLKVSWFLLNRVQNVGSLTNETGTTLMHCAAIVGDVGLLKTLQQRGLEAYTRNFHHKNPLYYAIQYGQLEAVEFLLPETLPYALKPEEYFELQKACHALYHVDHITIEALGGLKIETIEVVKNFLRLKSYQMTDTPNIANTLYGCFFTTTETIINNIQPVFEKLSHLFDNSSNR